LGSLVGFKTALLSLSTTLNERERWEGGRERKERAHIHLPSSPLLGLFLLPRLSSSRPPIPPLSSLTSSPFFARLSPRYLRHLPILARHLNFHHDPLLVRSSSTQPISFPRCALGPDRPPFPPSLYPRSLAVALMAFSYELLQSKINLYNRRVATSLVLNYPASSPGAASVGRSASPEGGSFPAGMR